MPENHPDYEQTIYRSVTIHVLASKVWAALTVPELMKQWMSETEIEVITEWKVGSPILIQGPWYKTGFKTYGTVLHNIPYSHLAYTHLSSLSRLPDKPEHYTTLDFRLTEQNNHTVVDLTLSNFPTYAINKHLAFYWNVAIVLLKKFVEGAQY
ncbi:SRPBCC domain-containing protein [Flavipsychrobacter stenotrophus]|uniref:SRPBCC domain-containing protein n=1 Tax=Flavipsychrobacter stenotrophus TaxID=2077091 RepID=A0A2S7SYZ4_9BACT|nr:SRPBCC domain-containing protein [Flavipsychrobacter stenotrophus]PQJ11831.1 SRPBCC domain-containing protein [Flavipsychrobacter stenotrophus]